MGEIKTVAIGGEIGDAILAFPTLRALGLVNVVCPERNWTRPNWPQRSQSLKRLAESQSYIQSWNPHQGEPIDLDLTTYRNSGWRHGDLIPNRIARWARVRIDPNEPWLEVDPDPKTKGKILLSRAPRWVGPGNFPYKRIVEEFREDLLFVGIEPEWKTFCAQYGMVPFYRTQDHHDIARAVKGCELLISAQSSVFAVAMGLGHRSLLEVCIHAPDVLFDRENLQCYIDGPLSFEALGRKFEADPVPIRIDRNIPPQGGYRVTIGETTFQAWDFTQLEQMARAECLLKGLSYPVSEIQAMIERDSGRPIPFHVPRLKAA